MKQWSNVSCCFQNLNQIKANYEEIKDYVLKQSGLKVSNLYITQVKQKCGIIERESYNKPKFENAKQPKCLLRKKKLSWKH